LTASLVLILSGRVAFYPVKLGWYDLKVMDTFRTEIIDKHGVSHALDSSWMSLYDYVFDNSQFCFLVDERLISCGGTTDSPSYASEVEGLNPETLETFKKRRGVDYSDATERARLSAFMRNYFKNYNAWSGRAPFFFPAAPRHVHRTLFKEGEPPPEEIQAVRIHFIENIYDHDRNEVISLKERIVAEVTIP
jgi:hypothetical protein